MLLKAFHASSLDHVLKMFFEHYLVFLFLPSYEMTLLNSTTSIQLFMYSTLSNKIRVNPGWSENLKNNMQNQTIILQRPIFFSKIGPKYNLAVIIAQKRAQPNGSHT